MSIQIISQRLMKLIGPLLTMIGVLLLIWTILESPDLSGDLLLWLGSHLTLVEFSFPIMGWLFIDISVTAGGIYVTARLSR